jgi:hypothetical protein
MAKVLAGPVHVLVKRHKSVGFQLRRRLCAADTQSCQGFASDFPTSVTLRAVGELGRR